MVEQGKDGGRIVVFLGNILEDLGDIRGTQLGQHVVEIGSVRLQRLEQRALLFGQGFIQ